MNDGRIDWTDTTLRPSRRASKKECDGLELLGQRLLEVPDAELEQMAIGEALRAAIRDCRKIRAHEARRRQNLLIAKLLREEDAELLEAALGREEGSTRRQAECFRELEGWRSRIIEEGDEAIEAFLEAYPSGDRQALRRLGRVAREQAQEPKGQQAHQKLFRVLRSAVGV